MPSKMGEKAVMISPTLKIVCKAYSHTKKLLGTLLSKRKVAKYDRCIKILENEINKLEKQQVYTFEVMVGQWFDLEILSRLPEVTLCLQLASLIPPSTAEVERSFSLMKLICTPLQSHML